MWSTYFTAYSLLYDKLVIGGFISQLIRFCTINLLLEDFKNDDIELAVIIFKKGFKSNMLKIKSKQFARDNAFWKLFFG